MKKTENYEGYQEYPKWVKTLDNRDIIVDNEEEELLHTTEIKEEENEPIKDNSKGSDQKVINPSGGNRSGRKSK